MKNLHAFFLGTAILLFTTGTPVRAVEEGSGEQLENFLAMVKRGPSASRVDESHAEWETVTGEFEDFQMKVSR